MPAMSRGDRPQAKPQLRVAKRVKGGTKSNKNHTFESFAQRIARLKIEPIRRGRSTIIDDAELEATFSYFRDALVELRDINLSEIFSTFARRVAPLCDSLPQVLHHDERIFQLLIENIEKGDKNSEEPLLKLLANFAHDLGVRFEKHFGRAVQTVANLAATHADVEVIEWSFTCLAWLFKYLSRLLVPDLRPVFDVMTPLLGKTRQKLFVMRFAAESLSFLVRKAGAAYHRDQSPLRTILRHVSELIKESQDTTQEIDFQQGLMTLFADSLKGVQRGLHSSAVAILKEMLLQVYDEDYADLPKPPLEFVLKGVITSVIHHSDAEHFQPLLETILDTVKSKASDNRYIGVSSRLLFVVCGVRKGSRVAQWPPVLETTNLLFQNGKIATQIDAAHVQELLSTLAVVFQYCPIDAAIPHTQLLDKLSKQPLEPYFLSFCNTFSQLGRERFNTLLLSYFKRSVFKPNQDTRVLTSRRFVAQRAQEHKDELCVILPSLYEHGIVPKDSLSIPASWQAEISDRFQQLAELNSASNDSDRVVYECNAYLHIIGGLVIPLEKKQSISHSLYKALVGSIKESGNEAPLSVRIFVLGYGFEYLANDNTLKEQMLQLWPSLCSVASSQGGGLTFWKALLSLAEINKETLDFAGSHVTTLKQALIPCLGSPSHDLRLVALGLVEVLASDTEERRNAISTASIIEQTPINLETQRSVSMRIGQLARLYPTLASDDLLGEVIPTYLFGLLHVRLASVWDDVCSALKIICESKEGESHVLRVAYEWISQSHNNAESASTSNEVTAPKRYVSIFECTNVEALERTIGKSHAMLADIEEQLQAQFEHTHTSVYILNDFSRTQALRVLNSLPAVAEKRSRILVPVLLDWAFAQRVTDVSEDDAIEETAEEGSRWTRKDRKEMLTLFSKFTNPKVLYRSMEVYQALLALLENGDVEVQKLALKTILAWKEPGIVEYQENLFNLLDDSRFRDEVSVFLDSGSDQSAIKEHHRDTLLPVLLRLLYGKVISGKRGLDMKRKAVFQALVRLEDSAINQFIEIALGSLNDIQILQDEMLDDSVLQADLMPPRKQIGLINMLEDMLSALETTIRPFVASLVNPILYCLINASRALTKSNAIPGSEVENSQTPIYRSIRQRALHALNTLFESSPTFPWTPYASTIVAELVTPRLQQFPIETAQSVSGLLRLFSAWSKSAVTATFIVDFNSDILIKIVECLDVPSAKDEVKQFVLDNILRELISLLASGEEESTDAKIQRNRIQTNIIQPYANVILSHVGALLRKSPSKELLESSVHTVAELAPYVIGSSESRSIIEISSFLIKQPSQRVNAATKLGLLKILHEFIPRCQSIDMSELFDTVFDAVCPLFSYLKDRNARTLLCNVIEDLSSYNDDLFGVATLCHGLNAYSTSRLDEPDFDRRSAAFGEITGGLSFTLVQWKPLIHNMLFFIKDNDELSIRVNASLALRYFIKSSSQEEDVKDFISAAILPGIQFGMREPSELVRVEFLSVLAQLVETYRDWKPVADLHILLSAEEEASFFNNILHIQNHRRLRALRRLASNASHVDSRNIYHILLPLLEHFVFNKADDDNAAALSGETVKTITTLCLGLEWPQFRSLLKRYIGYLSSKEDMQKTIIKLLSGLLDSLNRAGRGKGYVSSTSQEVQTSKESTVDVEETNDTGAMEVDDEEQPLTLSKTLPQQEKLSNDIINHFLPDLNEFLRKKDESTVSLRVPVAIAVCKALLVLPPTEVENRLPALLLDISHILRSRDQGSRDMARNTLNEIATFTGPTYFGFILRALRIALARGYQLHVLSFTVHSILVRLADQLEPGDLDYCVADVVDVIMDDIFGVTGQEKNAEEYISKMKEVKSSKSFDSMDIIARSTTPGRLIALILPTKSLLSEKLNARAVQKIDELLRRIGMGVLQNPTVHDRDILVFCHELVQEVYRSQNSTEKVEHVEQRNRKFLINMKGAAKSGARQSTSLYTYKLIRFSLDILRTVLRKHEDLQTAQNLSGWLPILGDALVAGQEEIQISAIRLLSTIIKVPMKELDESCPVYVTEAVRAIKGAASSNSELALASLKLLTSILRERPNVQIREQDLGNLLRRILPDIDEPDRQGVTFGFLKALMGRKIVIVEVYEVMDKVAAMMITNQTRSARDVARSSYFNFLMSYPQAKNRFKKQLEFLLKNLRFDYVEGRQSVMEALSLILNKVGDNVLQDHLDMVFLPLVHSMANDDSADCRTMAGALVKTVFERANSQQLKSFSGDLREWLTQDEDPGLKRLGIQCWGFYLEVVDAKPKELEFVMEQLRTVLETCSERRDEDDWELLYYAMVVFQKLCKSWPDYTLSSSREAMWASFRSCVSYPHAWVKLTAAKLLGTFFADLSSANSESGLESVPLEGSRGLQLGEEAMVKLTHGFLRNLESAKASEDLCIQSVRNLAFLARCLAANGIRWNWKKVDDEEDGSDDEGNVAEEGEGEGSDDEWGGCSPPLQVAQAKKTKTVGPTAMHRLMTRLSGIIRRETKIMKLSSLYAKSATATLLETLVSKLPMQALESSLPHLLTTLSTLTDPATTIPRSTEAAFNETYRAIIDKSREIMSTLQKSMGGQEFLDVMGDVQKGVRHRREERRQKRKIAAVAEPEKFGQEKKRRNSIKKVKRKEKSQEYRGKRRGW